MSVRTVNLRMVACDHPGCDKEASGPCLLCGKTFCYDHSYNFSHRSLVGTVCHDELARPISALIEAFDERTQKKVWDAFRALKECCR